MEGNSKRNFRKGRDDKQKNNDKDGFHDNEEEEAESDDESSDEEVGIALELPKRVTRGKKMTELIGEAMENDNKFWQHNTWEESEQDDEYRCSEGEEMYKDEVDTDFDVDEDDDENNSSEGEKKGKERFSICANSKKANIIDSDDDERKKKKKKMLNFEKLWKTKQKALAAQRKKKKENERKSQNVKEKEIESNIELVARKKGHSDDVNRSERESEKKKTSLGKQANKRKRGNAGYSSEINEEKHECRFSPDVEGNEKITSADRDIYTKIKIDREQEKKIRFLERQKNRKTKRDNLCGFTLDYHLEQAKQTEKQNTKDLENMILKAELKKITSQIKKNPYKGNYDIYLSWASYLIIDDENVDNDIEGKHTKGKDVGFATDEKNEGNIDSCINSCVTDICKGTSFHHHVQQLCDENGASKDDYQNCKSDLDESNSDDETYAKEMIIFTDTQFPDIYNQGPPISRNSWKCAVTGGPAKYRDPLTKCYYSSKEAFRVLRSVYNAKRFSMINECLHRIQTKLIPSDENFKKT